MDLLVIRYSEIALKGNNRGWFEKQLVKNIRKHLKEVTENKIERIRGRIFVELEDQLEEAIEVLKCVPGIANFSVASRTSHDFDEMGAKAVEITRDYLEKNSITGKISFKVDARRCDKNFPKKSMEIGAELGGVLLRAFPDFYVKLTEPELSLGVEILQNDEAVLYIEKIQGAGGLPIGSSGNVMSFLSGGIDSPVASWMCMTRGCKTIYMSFHSYPFTGENSKQKIIDLVEHLSRYQPHSTLLIAPFAEIQKAIKENCAPKYRTLLYRRAMYKIGERLKDQYRIKAYVTGEAVGQVASQTLENMLCIGDAASLPVLRPVVGMEKAQIIKLAQQIGTFPISIKQAPDCCTVFLPEKAETHGTVREVHFQESRIENYEELLKEAVENVERLTFETKITNKFWDEE